MDGARNKGALMEPTLGLVERRVRLEHHMLELLELERDHLVKKERLLEKIEPLLEECGLPPRRVIERGKREAGEVGVRQARKRNELSGDEVGNLTRQVAGGSIKTWEQLYASHPDVTKGALKKLGNELKQAGVWVPKAEVKKPKEKKGEEKGGAAAAAAPAAPEKKKKKTSA